MHTDQSLKPHFQMDSIHQQVYNHESQHLSPIKNHPPLPPPPPPPPNTSFPMLTIAVLCIMATAFLLVTYYIFVTRCCFHWQQINPFRHFSITRSRTRRTEDPLMAYSPSWHSRGLDETLIREIPTFQYTKRVCENEERSLNKCVVCLSEFQELDTLRVLPNCKHAFHLDCIDIWLQNNANCPLCRLSISGPTRYPMDRIIAPTSSPQDPQPFISNAHTGNDEDFVVIELGIEGNESRQQSRRHSSSPRKFEEKSLKTRKSHPLSSMGDECINVREKDDQFSIQPIRRSFSMDSAADRQVYSSVQEIIRQNGHQNVARNNEECSNRVRRPFFSFGNGRGSRSAVLPLEL